MIKDTADAAMEAAINESGADDAFYGMGDEVYDEAFANGVRAGYNAAMNREWTPVSERLPDEDGYYLATVGSVGIDPSETTCHELNWFKGVWYLPNDEMIAMPDVIAWMPLPEPYQPDSGEEKNDE